MTTTEYTSHILAGSEPAAAMTQPDYRFSPAFVVVEMHGEQVVEKSPADEFDAAMNIADHIRNVYHSGRCDIVISSEAMKVRNRRYADAKATALRAVVEEATLTLTKAELDLGFYERQVVR